MHWLSAARRDFAAEIEWENEPFDEYEAENNHEQGGRQYQQPPPRRKTPEIKRQEAFQSLFLQPDAPPELVKVAHRTLALMFHPDKPSGDLKKMQRINSAYDELRDLIAA